MINLNDFLGETSSPSFDEIMSWLPEESGPPGRIILLTDVHANWPALAATLEHARGAYDTIWFLGDIVGYGPHPVECVRFLQRVSPERQCIGNHDLGVAGTLSRHLFGFKPSENALWAWKRHREQIQQYSPAFLQWFEQTIRDEKVKPIKTAYGNYAQLFVHAIIEDPVGFSLYPDDWGNLLNNLRLLEKEKTKYSKAAWLIVGHTHMVTLSRLKANSSRPELLPVIYGEPITIDNGLYLINPGSVGQPRDGDCRAAYAILDVERGAIEFHRVEYSIEAVQQDMIAQGYPNELVNRLWTGRIRDTQNFEAAYRRTEKGLKPKRV